MAIFQVPCSHIDYPCCGCQEFAYTGQDAIEQAREDDEAQDILDRDQDDGQDEPWDGFTDAEADADTLASAGYGTDEDYNPCSTAGWEDQFEGGEF